MTHRATDEERLEQNAKDEMKQEDEVVVGESLVSAEESNEAEEQKREGDDKLDVKEDYGYLCTIMCDFFCGLAPKPSLYCERGLTPKVLSAFRKCDKDVPCDLGDDTIAIDIRGRHVDDALEIMMTNLYYCSRKPDLKKLYVTVGCKVHGCGEGKLFKAVTDLLKLDEGIGYEKLYNGVIISIPLQGKKDYKSLGWSVDGFVPLPDEAFEETSESS